jgi:hypothetical protein
MKQSVVMHLFLIILCGCSHPPSAELESPAAPPLAHVTCKPQFELQERQDIHVVDAEGNDRTSSRQWLILDDGKQKRRIAWASPPMSRAPVALSAHETYTFTVRTGLNMTVPFHTVIRIAKGNEVIYDVSKEEPSARR